MTTKSEISGFRFQCSFSYGIALTEMDDNDEFVQMYEHELPQTRRRKTTRLPQGDLLPESGR